MILVDTAIWIDHLSHADPVMHSLLEDRALLMHPFVLGEIVLGTLRRRDEIIEHLRTLPSATKAEDEEVIDFIGMHELGGSGVGFIDAHLLASCALSEGTFLWTKDRRLATVAARLGVDAASA